MGEVKSSEAVTAIIEFLRSYHEADLLEKNRENIKRYKDKLTESEKDELLLYFSENASVRVFCVYAETIEKVFDYNMALECLKRCFSVNKSSFDLLIVQQKMYSGIEFILNSMDEKYHQAFLNEAMILAVKDRAIFIVHELMKKNVEPSYVNAENESMQSVLENMDDKSMVEFVQFYIEHGTIMQSYEEYFTKESPMVYKPVYYKDDVDYFAAEGLEICKQVLKSYRKSKLLNNQTSLKELNDFIDKKYNWDDGIEVPYFIMHHKNCDLDLKKKLFELGGGDCIDEDTYKDVNEDPWKIFILELDKMIKEEEKNGKGN